MLRRPNPCLIFLFAIILLMLSGVATGVTVYRLYEGVRWVHHGFEVELTVGAIESSLSKAARTRLAFVNGDAQALLEFDDARNAASRNLSRLQAAIEGRLGVLEESIQLAKSRSSDKGDSRGTDCGADPLEFSNRCHH
ncbi:MAG: hypothetical protein ABR953_02210 [Candidatus Acidiferrales bacterium]|jgi:CHASE3 domain sensor protein